MKVVRFTWAAADDLESIVRFINEDNPRAARAVADKIYGACMSLDNFPERGRMGRIRGTRELVIGSVPYLAVYRVEQETVHIMRIMHMARRR